jgi:hypothetical protein
VEAEQLIDHLCSNAIALYALRPIPTAMDEDVRQLLNLLFPKDGSICTEILNKLNQQHGFLLNGFALRMASYSVRTCENIYIKQGIRALNAASRLIYWKEVIPTLVLLYNSMIKIDADPKELLISLPCAGRQFKLQIEEFEKRNEYQRSVVAMGYAESQDKDGFLYVHTGKYD